MLRELVPVTALAVNFSPIPRIAPPPLGRLICGALNWDVERSLSEVSGIAFSAISASPVRASLLGMVNLQSQAFHPFFVFPDFGFSAFPIEAPPFASCAASAVVRENGAGVKQIG